MPIRRPVEVAERKQSASDVSAEKLFNWARVKQGTPLLHKMLFLVWLPFGIVLAVARALLFTVLSFMMIVLPRPIGDIFNPFLLRAVTGLVIFHNHKGTRLYDQPHVLASNHVSDFDSFALWSTTPKWACVTSAHLKAIPVIGALYTALDAIFVSPNPDSKELVRKQIKDKLEKNDVPVLIFPEGGLTNGKVGTMLYQKFVFSLDVPVVPVAIRLNDPWPIENDYLGSSWGKNWFWFLAVPWHIVEITFLPIETRRDDETPEEFAFRVQTITSESIGQVATKHSYSDKKELIRKLKEKKKTN